MVERIAAFDWNRSRLGPRASWPASLRLMVGVALRSRFPMLVFWGADLVQVYNDAFIPILGARHPAALGQVARDCWPEVWDTIGPLLTEAREAGTPVWGEDWPVVLERNGYPEPTNFTFSYSQFGDEGDAGGVLCTCIETTKAVAREDAFRDLATRLGRELDREHRALVAFQNAALPKALPTVSGLHFDAIYEAAGEDALVGGDWYDAFRLTDGRVVISVGDVMGSGLDASVTMAAARQAIRGAAQVFPEPGAVLDAADRALRSEQRDRIVTAFLGIMDPLTGLLSYASAGHPPPLLRTPDGEISELDATDLPLGLRNERVAKEDTTVTLSEGAMLVLYTDGLTESTRNVFEGEQRLREALKRDDVRDSSRPAAAIRRAVFDAAADDVAILTVKFDTAAIRIPRWSFPSSNASAAHQARVEVSGLLRALGATEAEVSDAQTVFGELLGNVFRHTNEGVEAALDVTVDEPVLHVLDRGPGFTFYARLPKDTMSESGRGLYIAAVLARDISIVPRPGGGSHARAVLKLRHARARTG